MRSSVTAAGLAAAASLLVSSTVAQLSKTQITNPELRSSAVWWRQNDDMDADLPEHSFMSEDWDNNYIPELFLSLFYQNPDFNYSVWDVETKNVFFSDCPIPNVVSRHKNSSKSWDEVLRVFSKSPVGIRQHMSDLLVIPDNSLIGAAAYAPGAACVIVSNQMLQPTLVHEGFHGLDLVLFRDEVPDPTTRYSESNGWWTAYDNDTHVITSYARTNQIENWAETGHWSFADISRGLSTYTPRRSQVATQMDLLRAKTERVMFPAGWPAGGNCTGKVTGTAIVDKRSRKRLDLAGGGGGGRGRLGWAMPRRPGSEHIPIIELPAGLDWTPPKPPGLPPARPGA